MSCAYKSIFLLKIRLSRIYPILKLNTPTFSDMLTLNKSLVSDEKGVCDIIRQIPLDWLGFLEWCGKSTCCMKHLSKFPCQTYQISLLNRSPNQESICFPVVHLNISLWDSIPLDTHWICWSSPLIWGRGKLTDEFWIVEVGNIVINKVKLLLGTYAWSIIHLSLPN